MPIVKLTAAGSKPVQRWTAYDILQYYSNKLWFTYGVELRIPNAAAQRAFNGRVLGFQRKLKLSNQQYQKFIDDVFTMLFNDRNFSPSFGSIVSEQVYHLVVMIRNHGDCDRTDLYQHTDLAQPIGSTPHHVG